MSFASSVTVLGDAPPPVHSSESSAQELLRSAVAEEDAMDTGGGSRTLVRHVVPRSGYDGGNATTQRRLSNADELGHFRPVRVGTTRNGLETREQK